MTHPKRVLIALDQLFAVVLFRDDMHCAQAYVAEMAGTQNAPIYRKE